MVIDAHTHVGVVASGAADDVISHAHESETDPSDPGVDYDLRTRVMDQNGIDATVALPSFMYDRSDGIESTRRLNDSMLQIADKHERIVCGLGTVEPLHGDRALDEIERLDRKGCKGVAWHHGQQGLGLDSKRSLDCIEKTAELGMLPVIHCLSPHWPFEHLDRLDRVARSVGDHPMIVLDALTVPENVQKIVEIGRKHEHLVFDTALLYSTGQIVDAVVDALGAERLVFGSNLFTRPLMYEYSADLFQVRKAGISERERDLVLGGNIERLLDL